MNKAYSFANVCAERTAAVGTGTYGNKFAAEFSEHSEVSYRGKDHIKFSAKSGSVYLKGFSVFNEFFKNCFNYIVTMANGKIVLYGKMALFRFPDSL